MRLSSEEEDFRGGEVRARLDRRGCYRMIALSRADELHRAWRLLQSSREIELTRGFDHPGRDPDPEWQLYVPASAFLNEDCTRSDVQIAPSRGTSGICDGPVGTVAAPDAVASGVRFHRVGARPP